MKYLVGKEVIENEDLAEVAWAAIENIWDELPFSNYPKLKKFMLNLTKGQQALISIDWCQKEIRNGGLQQLFENSTGNLADYAIRGFLLINASPYADIMTKAVGLFPAEYPRSSAARKREIKKFSKSQIEYLNGLSVKFIDLINSKDTCLEQLRGGYVKNNPSQFTYS